MRDPWISRPAMSRPRWSVPAMNRVPAGSRPPGDSRRRPRSCASMSPGASHGANTAVDTRQIRTAQETANIGFWVMRRRNISPSADRDASVEHHVNDVDNEIGDYKDHRGNHDHHLDDGVVAVAYRTHEESACSGPAEDGFRYDRTAQKGANLQPQHGNHRRECIPEGMPHHHGGFREALCSGGADVVLTDHLEHARARDARYKRYVGQSERDSGEHQMLKLAVSGGGEEPELYGHEQDQHDAKPEHRN